MSFRLKTIIGIAMIQAILLILLFASTSETLQNAHRELLLNNAHAAANFLARDVANAIAEKDPDSLHRISRSALNIPGITYVRIRSADNSVLATSGNEQAIVANSLSAGEHITPEIVAVSIPVTVAGSILGTLDVAVDARSIEAVLYSIRQQNMFAAVILILLSAHLSFYFGSYLTRQLKTLADGAHQISVGNLGFQVPVTGRDELAQATIAFNRMSQALLTSHRDLLNAVSQLQKDEATLVRAQKIANIGSWEYNRETHRLTGSQQLHEIFGTPSGQPVSSRVLSRLVPIDEWRRLRKLLRQLASTKRPSDAVLKIYSLAGNEKMIHVYIEPVLDENASLISCFGIVQDVTERHHMEQQAHSARLEKLEVQASSHARDQLFSQMGHELRTPLNTIIGYSEMLAEESSLATAPQHRKDLETINKSGKHLLHLINAMLEQARRRSGRMELHPESVEIHKLLLDIANTIQPLVKTRNNRLVLDIAADIGRIYTDLTKLRQSLFNLLSNACKFTENGTIALTATRATESDPETVCFRISDNGAGMSAEQVQSILHPSSQSDDLATRRQQGNGLGLTVTRRFLDLLGGTLTIQSAHGVGTTFTVTIPTAAPMSDLSSLSDSDEAEVRRRFTVPVNNTERRTRYSTVLVVEDDRDVSGLLERYLKNCGFHVLLAYDGKEAMHVASISRPDIIMLDIMMPVMDGWATLRELKQAPTLMDVPVIMISALGDSDMAYSLGASDFIMKPVNLEHLGQVIKKRLRRTAVESADGDAHDVVTSSIIDKA